MPPILPYESRSVSPLATRMAQWLIGQTEGPLPIYGSEEWHALPPGDLRITASAMVAAECWREVRNTGVVNEELAEEIEAGVAI